MARITIDIPTQPLAFSTVLDVRVTDLNYGQHLGNDSMLSLIHEARVRFLGHHGMSETDVDGCALVMADAAVVYKAEAFAGDRLEIEVGVGDKGRVGCDLVYRVTRREPGGAGTLVALAKTGIVFLDPDSRRPVPLPGPMLALD